MIATIMTVIATKTCPLWCAARARARAPQSTHRRSVRPSRDRCMLLETVANDGEPRRRRRLDFILDILAGSYVIG